jgi:hypothetical protein
MNFKDDKTKERWELLHPIVKDLVNSVNAWSLAYDKKPITLTSTVSTPEEDKALKRVSPAHAQGRAVDIRTSDMPKQKLVALMQIFTEKFKHLGYLTQKGERRLMYYHNNGNGPHIHLAIGIDVVEKYKAKYSSWHYPVFKSNKTVKTVKE